MTPSEGGGGDNGDTSTRTTGTTTHSIIPHSRKFQDNDLVGAVGVKEGAGEIEGALGAYVPEPSEVETVDPNVAFGETVEADEALGFTASGECAAEELGELLRAARPIQLLEVVEGEGRDVKVHEGLIVEHDGGDALAVAEFFAVIDPAHGVHEDGDLVPLFHALREEGVLARELENEPALVDAAEGPPALSVDIDVGEIPHITHGDEPRAVVAGKDGAVKDEPEILPVLFHGKRQGGTVLHAHGILVLHEPRTLGEADLADVLRLGLRRQNRRFNPLF